MPKFIINDKLNGVELYFDRIPSEQERNELKSRSWRWNPKKRCWWNKKTGYTLEFAKSICGAEQKIAVAKQEELPAKKTIKPIENPTSIQPERKKGTSNQIKTNKWVDGILTRIRSNDSFKDFKNDYSYHLKLMDHQKAGSIIAEKYNKFAFFYDTGTGKTVMTLNIIAEKFKTKNAHFLIIAPKPLIKNAWLDDADNYFPQMQILPLSANISFEEYKDLYDKWAHEKGEKEWEQEYDTFRKLSFIKEKLIMRAHHYLINLDQIRDLEKAEELIRKTGVNGLIVDESSILKNYDSKSSHLVRTIAKTMEYVYLLSGKPAPNSPLEFFSQMKIVDPETFHMSFNSFREAFFMQRGRYKYVLKNQFSARDVTGMVGQRSIIVRKEECLDLPEKTSIKRVVDLDKKTLLLYSDVLRNFVTEIIDMDGRATITTTMSKLARIVKLREIACGFYLDERDKFYVSDEKNSALIGLLEDEIGSGEQVIIWCNFQFEIETIEKELKNRHYSVVTAYGKTKNLDESIQKFKNGSAQYMIAHPKTLKYGVTFINCHYAVYNSLSFSLEDYYQSHDRIYRKGQGKKCFFYHLLSRDTIEAYIYSNLSDKHMTAKVFEDLIKKSSNFGVDKMLIEKARNVNQQTVSVATSARNAEQAGEFFSLDNSV